MQRTRELAPHEVQERDRIAEVTKTKADFGSAPKVSADATYCIIGPARICAHARAHPSVSP